MSTVLEWQERPLGEKGISVRPGRAGETWLGGHGAGGPGTKNRHAPRRSGLTSGSCVTSGVKSGALGRPGGSVS